MFSRRRCAPPAAPQSRPLRARHSPADEPTADAEMLAIDLEAEQAVLGAIMANTPALRAAAKVVSAGDFYRATHGLIFSDALDLAAAGTEVDPVTLADAMVRAGHLKRLEADGGRGYLHVLAEMVPTATNVVAYARTMHRLAEERRLRAGLNEAAEILWRPDLNGKRMLTLEAKLAELAARCRPDEAADASDESDYLDWPALWAPVHDESEWLYPDVLARGRGHVIYAERKVGKSLFDLWLAAELATGREPIVSLYLDYEQSADDIRERLEDMGYGPESDLSRLRYALWPTLPPLDTPEGGEALCRRLDTLEGQWPEHHIALFLDTFGRAVEGPEDKADTIRAFYAHSGIELKRRGLTWVRLDHSGKDPTRGQRGSSGKGDDVDVVWAFTKTNGGICLKRDAARMNWVPDKVTLGLLEEPLRFVRLAEDWPAGTGEVANILDRLELPLGVSVRAAQTALRSIKEGRQQVLVRAALRWRREHAGEAF